jgi:hypothetical protein
MNNGINFTVNSQGTATINSNAQILNINNKRPRAIPLPYDDALTREHKAALYALRDKWVELKAIQAPTTKTSSLFSSINKRINQQAKSIGKNGVTSILEYPDCDFERGEKFLRQQIAILNKAPKVVKQSPTWRNGRIGSIRARCKELRIDNDTRKAYQWERFKCHSLADFNEKQLKAMYDHVFTRSPSFDVSKIKSPDRQHKRENVLAMLLGELNAKHGGALDMNALDYSIDDMFMFLTDKSSLFDGLSLATFKTFWKKQKICQCVRGVRAKS